MSDQLAPLIHRPAPRFPQIRDPAASIDDQGIAGPEAAPQPGQRLEVRQPLELEPEAVLIYSVAVRPDLQGRGLGRRLLGLAEEQALEAGRSRVRLYTNERFTENIGLYLRAGYREARREPYLGTQLVHMEKELHTL